MRHTRRTRYSQRRMTSSGAIRSFLQTPRWRKRNATTTRHRRIVAMLLRRHPWAIIPAQATRTTAAVIMTSMTVATTVIMATALAAVTAAPEVNTTTNRLQTLRKATRLRHKRRRTSPRIHHNAMTSCYTVNVNHNTTRCVIIMTLICRPNNS